MADPIPTLDYARPEKPSSFPWPSVIAFVLDFLITPILPCACGHLSTIALPVTIAAAVFGWWGFCRNTRFILWRLLALGNAIFVTLILAKNLGDVLWYGHNPIFP